MRARKNYSCFPNPVIAMKKQEDFHYVFQSYEPLVWFSSKRYRAARPIISRFQSLNIRQSAFLNYTKLIDPRSSGLWKCRMFGRSAAWKADKAFLCWPSQLSSAAPPVSLAGSTGRAMAACHGYNSSPLSAVARPTLSPSQRPKIRRSTQFVKFKSVAD